MTLDEEIKQLEKIAEEKEKLANTYESFQDYGNPKSSITSGHEKCLKCAEEHRQLAEWLKELKKLKEQEPCEDCINRQDVINAIANTCFWLSADNWEELMECINSIPSVRPKEDCISRKQVEEITWQEPTYNDGLNVLTEVRDKIRALPSVRPKEEVNCWIKETLVLPLSDSTKIDGEYEKGYRDGFDDGKKAMFDELRNGVAEDKKVYEREYTCQFTKEGD